jgi:hypothetical protein
LLANRPRRGWCFDGSRRSRVLRAGCPRMPRTAVGGMLARSAPHRASSDAFNSNDTGVLYATGPASQRLVLTVRVDTFDGPTTEAFQISNRGRSPIRWAFLLTGGARLRKIAHSSAHIEDQAIVTDVWPPQKGQLLSGRISGYSQVTFQGYSFGQFIANAAAHTIVSLPNYQEGTVPYTALRRRLPTP